MRALAVDLSGQDVELKDAFNLVAEKLDAHGAVVPPRRKDLDDVAAHAEVAALEGNVVALVPNGDKLAQDILARDRLPLVQRQDHLMVALRRAEAVDARDARDDDAVAPLKERARRRMAQLVDLVVDRRILLDVRIGRRNVRLGLVVVIIADEVADVILREERLELARELRRQRLVVRDDQGRLLHALDRLGDRVRLARARSAEKNLRLLPVLDARRQVPNRTRLIPHRLERRRDLERYLLVKLHRIELRQNRHACASLVQSIATVHNIQKPPSICRTCATLLASNIYPHYSEQAKKSNRAKEAGQCVILGASTSPESSRCSRRLDPLSQRSQTHPQPRRYRSKILPDISAVRRYRR